MGNAEVWLPLMWGAALGVQWCCQAECVWRGEVGKPRQVGVPWEDWPFLPHPRRAELDWVAGCT